MPEIFANKPPANSRYSKTSFDVLVWLLLGFTLSSMISQKRFQWRIGKIIVETLARKGTMLKWTAIIRNGKVCFVSFVLCLINEIARSCCTLRQWWFLNSTEGWSEMISAWLSSTSIVMTNMSLSIRIHWLKLEPSLRFVNLSCWRLLIVRFSLLSRHLTRSTVLDSSRGLTWNRSSRCHHHQIMGSMLPRRKVSAHRPRPRANALDFVLTKFSNGMDMAFKCPPLVRLKQIPRISALQSLGEKCAKFEKEREGILLLASPFDFQSNWRRNLLLISKARRK